jgi:molybdopterin-biosynthesis enzyme MoeA-like protein
MAGVPAIMQAMLEAATQQLTKGQLMNTVSFVLEQPEAEIAELFANHQAAYPDVAMGSYPTFVDGHYRTELVLRSKDRTRLEKARIELGAKLAARSLL